MEEAFAKKTYMRSLVTSPFVAKLTFVLYTSSFAGDTTNESVSFDKVFHVDSRP
jgi:hypothetical protein